MNCELMLTYDTPTLRQTGSKNLTDQKTLPTIWGTYMENGGPPTSIVLVVIANPCTAVFSLMALIEVLPQINNSPVTTAWKRSLNKMYIMMTVMFWNNLHQVRSKSKNIKVFDSKKTKGPKQDS
jgi:hypothetical protein